MPAAIAGPVAGAVVGGLMSDSGGGGTQTATKEPWDAAAPWLKALLGQGQDLSNYYTHSPFNQYQQQAYGQLFGQNNYLQGAIPGLLSQLSQPMGYTPGNPSARPAPIQFPAMGLLAQSGGGASPGTSPGGLLGDLNVTANPFRNGAIAPPPVAAPAPPKEDLSKWYGFDRDLYGDT